MLNSIFQETLHRMSQRSGTKSHARLLTQHTLPACWTRVPSAWRRGCAWTAAARASALCPATSATWALGLHVLQNLCCSTSLKPRQSMSWSTATRPTRYLWLIMLYSHPADLARLPTEVKQRWARLGHLLGKTKVAGGQCVSGVDRWSVWDLLHQY